MISRSFLLNLCGCDKTGGLRTWAIMIILFLFKRFYSNLLPYPSLTLGVLSKDFKPDESKVPQNLRNSRCFLLLQEEERSSQDSDAKRVQHANYLDKFSTMHYNSFESERSVSATLPSLPLLAPLLPGN